MEIYDYRFGDSFFIYFRFLRNNVKFATEVVNFTRRQSDEAFKDLCNIMRQNPFSS